MKPELFAYGILITVVAITASMMRHFTQLLSRKSIVVMMHHLTALIVCVLLLVSMAVSFRDASTISVTFLAEVVLVGLWIKLRTARDQYITATVHSPGEQRKVPWKRFVSY